jgi:uncharacterized protein (DUF1697 family)
VTARYAALLSAVNVGKRRIAMEDLRQLLSGLGYRDVRTYLASGNAVFTLDEDRGIEGCGIEDRGDEDAMAATISAALKERFGFDVPCQVRGNAYLKAVLEACPFPADEIPGTQLHAVFYSADGAAERYADFDQQAFLPEEFRFGDRVMYLYVPGGLGRSPLAAALAKPAGRMKGIEATGRNWNTLKALLEMTDASAG